MVTNRSEDQERPFHMNLEIKGARRPLGIEFDETGTAFYVRIREGRSVVTRAVGDEVLADYDAKGKLLGFEVIGMTDERTATIPEEIRKRHPDEVPQMELVFA